MFKIKYSKFLFLFFTFSVAVGIFSFSHQAFASTVVTDDIIDDTTWTLDGSPYLVDGYVPVYSTLTIEPGVVVQNGSLDIFGTLKAEGTSDQHISFTSSIIYFDGSTGSSLKYIDISHEHVGMSFWASDASISNINAQYNDTDLYIEGGSSISISDSSFSNAKYDSIYIEDGSLSANNLTIEGGSQYYEAVRVRFGQVSMVDSVIQNIPDGEALAVGRLSNVDLERTNIKNVGRGFWVDESSTTNINDSTLDNTYVYAFACASFNADNSIFKNSIWGAIIDFGQGCEFNIVNSKFINNQDGFYIFNNGSYPESVYNISNSEISGNTQYGVYSQASYPVDFTKTWWGDASGPQHPDLNSTGLGNAVSDGVLFDQWCKNETCKTKTPVIIIPGILGSILSKNYGDSSEMWPNINTLLTSFFDGFMDDLALQADGTEDPAMPVSVGDILRKVDVLGNTVTDTWSGLIDKLTTSVIGGYVEGTDLFVFPYDWRKSDADTAVLLKDKIDAVLAQTGAEKVDIISHSMGGLIAEKYIADNGKDKINKLFFIGTPHLGAPKAFKALMYGDDMNIKFGSYSVLYPAEMKKISQNMPSAFDLLPSRIYVDGNPNASIVLPNQYVYDAVAGKWLNYDETKNFMITDGRNADIFPQADDLHQVVDKVDLSGVDVYNFAGCGMTKTLSTITAKKEKSWTSLWQKVVDDYDLGFTNGDETVPLISASGQYQNQYFIKGATHSELPSTAGVPETILALLSGDAVPMETNISTDSNNFCDVTGRVVSTHSPVTMHIYDDNGHHTGPTDNGDIEYGIPGVSYDVIGGDAFAFLPEGGNYKVVNKATDTGAYDFYIKDIGANDAITNETYFNEIPLTNLASSSEIDFTPSGNDYKIKMDQDGDNTFEKEFAPSSSLGATQANDLTAPETTASVAGRNLSFSSTDENSGVLKTEYSIDDGVSWVLYNSAFNASGKTVKYFSTDKAGNIESIKEIIVPKRHTAYVEDVVEDPKPVENQEVAHSSECSGCNVLSQNPVEITPIAKEIVAVATVTSDKIIIPEQKKVLSKNQKTIVKSEQVFKASKEVAKNAKIEVLPEMITASAINADNSAGFWSRVGNFIKSIFYRKKK
ncbi:MAG: alpha/beta fold hydrolase [Patescibacteria group bacterium]